MIKSKNIHNKTISLTSILRKNTKNNFGSGTTNLNSKPHLNSKPNLNSKPKSLYLFVESLRQDIIKRVNEPTDNLDLINFQEKFKEVQVEWSNMMNIMAKKINELDKRYMLLNYFDFKERIAHHLLNISLSFIVSRTLYTEITNFFSLLESVLNTILLQTKKSLELDKKHSIILSRMNSIISTLKKFTKEYQCLEDNIVTIINEKKQCNEIIRNAFYSLENCFEFDYFVHDNWCPYLDINIVDKLIN